jgi:SAM-dependent methyltransferase
MHNEPTMPYDPFLYSLTHRGNPGDVSLYLAFCQDANHILEVGCGTGRITRPLLEMGHKVTAIDVNEGMLATLSKNTPTTEQHRLTTHLADITNLQLGTTFSHIILPYNVLYCLLTPDNITTALRNVAAHLAPGGRCMFDLYTVDEEALTELTLDEWEPYATLQDDDGRWIEIHEKRTWNPDTQRIDAEYEYNIKTEARWQRETYAIPQMYLLDDQCVSCVQQAGLECEQIWGGFDGENYDEESEHLVIVAKKADEPQ